jgi:sugar lactone lactonase YvrE
VYVYRLSFVTSTRHPTAVISERRIFATAEVPVPDGLKVDTAGRLYVADGGGVSILEPHTGRTLLRVRPGDGGGAGAVLVMGQGAAVTAVDLPGATPFDVNTWL